jgi:hypothetical protein
MGVHGNRRAIDLSRDKSFRLLSDCLQMLYR